MLQILEVRKTGDRYFKRIKVVECCGLDMNCPSKVPVKGLIPSAMFRGEASGK
jgi:hypothetical protein